MNTGNCDTCKYGVLRATQLFCALNPPVATLVHAQGLTGPEMRLVCYRPEVNPADFCAHYAPAHDDSALLFEGVGKV